MKTFLPLMTWVEAAEAAAADRVVLLPVGTMDANGPQTPMGFDYLVAAALAETVAERTRNLWLPPITFGVSEALASFPGTVFVSPKLLGDQVRAVLQSIEDGGFGHIVVICNHGPNQYPVEYACRDLRRKTGLVVPVINPAQLTQDLRGDLFDDVPGAIGHGAEPGASLLLHLHPESVRTDLITPRVRNSFQGLEVLSPTELRFGASKVNVFLDLAEVSETAGWGDPTGASAVRGKELFRRMSDYVADFVTFFHDMDTRPAPPQPATFPAREEPQ